MAVKLMETPMSYDEMRQLNLDIKKLKGKHLFAIVQIIQAAEPPKSEHDVNLDEFLLDFGDLQPSTLRLLQTHVAACLGKKSGASPMTLEEKQQLSLDIKELEDANPMALEEKQQLGLNIKELEDASPMTLEEKQQLSLDINELEDANPMTLEEKQLLSLNINELREDDLEEIIDIIREENPSLQHIDLNEIGMHLETIQPSILREIKEFVDSALEKTHLEEPYTTRNKSPGLPWSYDERRKINLDMNRLKGKELGGVVNLMRSMEPTLRDVNPVEITIDFETLKSSTLDALETFVASCLQKRKSPPSKKSH